MPNFKLLIISVSYAKDKINLKGMMKAKFNPRGIAFDENTEQFKTFKKHGPKYFNFS